MEPVWITLENVKLLLAEWVSGGIGYARTYVCHCAAPRIVRSAPVSMENIFKEVVICSYSTTGNSNVKPAVWRHPYRGESHHYRAIISEYNEGLRWAVIHGHPGLRHDLHLELSLRHDY